jgi:hypothetical protein
VKVPQLTARNGPGRPLPLVQQAADLLLARARLAGDDHRVLPRRHPVDAVADRGHRRAGADQLHLRRRRGRSRGGEDEQRVAEAHDVAGLELLVARERLSVEPGAARTAEVAQHHLTALDADLRVPGRHLHVVEGGVEHLGAAPEHEPVARDGAPLERSACSTELRQHQGGLGYGRLRGQADPCVAVVAHVEGSPRPG